MAKNLLEIGELIENTKFRPKLVGGVDSLDVWTKVGRLNNEYAELFGITQQRAEAAIEEWREYAAKLESEVREKDERILWLTKQQASGNPRPAQTDRKTLPRQAADNERRIAAERIPQAQRVIRVQKCGLEKRNARGTTEPKRILSAEEIRRIYDDGNPALSSLYG